MASRPCVRNFIFYKVSLGTILYKIRDFHSPVFEDDVNHDVM